MVTGSASESEGGAAECIAPWCGKHYVQEHRARRLRPRRAHGIPQGSVAAANQSRLAVAHHHGQLGGRLARVERHDDDSLDHRGEVKCSPTDAVGSEQDAAVALAEPCGVEERARRRNAFEQFACSSGNAPLRPQLLEHDTTGRARQTIQNVFEEIHKLGSLATPQVAANARGRLSYFSTSCTSAGLSGGR